MYFNGMQIVFTTFNARYSHTSLSLRCLRANLGGLHELSEIVEFDIRISPQVAAEKLLAQHPQILLFSVYIWNIMVTFETVHILRLLRPDLKIIIGGPEASYEYEENSLFQLVDHLIRGEGETVIEKTCRDLLKGNSLPKVIESPPADLAVVALPYEEYTDEDIAHRRIYVESTRGCPFSCDYCLSSLEHGIRTVPLDRLFPIFGKLIERGARIFKFIDRSFNVCTDHAASVMEFFLENQCDGMMLHLEWEPHLLEERLEALLRKAPSGFFQLEVGVQTFTPEVAERINRRLNSNAVENNIRLLSTLPSVHLHADLIAGLPGETMDSLARSFDQLQACGPHEIQLGILKKLRGAPIAKHDQEFEMVYNTAPPYDVLQTSTMCFPELQAVRRFARFWDITVNNGRFPDSSPLIWKDQPSVFNAFMEWSQWLYTQTHAVFGFTPARLGRLLGRFLTEKRNLSDKEVSAAIEHDLGASATGAKGMERQARRKQ
ncbi:B12-binding domain-containing radical SAM protein [Tichowtungia aerotolerans]|uniref:DUF4080 domain-containing protein n=1 Tax=Tichowtungia aerotolerans TaxID=2697043 RepID=A0A6P1M995_9BACT|nr:radical SAM protein [Tichowtungia aerotolerans]QHI70467.1 DUF4080 domain-containing protein [Tichowtungia aerotolerans]